ncbi:MULTISPECIES: hypothetical protein [Cyanophyceae]|uniref:hypothetical protein n=1 Tax=Cyanophyceae TaxID=3028117 RepID=UPI00081083AA|nr:MULTISPECIES: hypothetical protein [Cyanophyceae]ANV87055.1 hypothetical protein AWQ22_06045 [Picosynechococcus sp. PCC 7117]SMH34022.1 hypothetical protein SAMN06272755_0525 [Picosynechococcus sp. OG1]SMQ84517.1 hypothetical protein SAMN06272774_2899 [Synechococcus sp. 7002]
MNQRTIEGTWEEILQHASELTGQQVRLTVLSPKALQPQQPMTLEQTLQDRIGRVQFQPSDLSARTKDAFADMLADKNQSWGHRS